MKLLTKTKSLLDNLKKIGIEDSDSLLSHLPYKYDTFYYDEENNFYDKKRIVLFGKLISTPKLVVSSHLDLVTFYFRSEKGNTYPVVAFGRTYLKSILNTYDDWTIIGTYDDKKKQINLISLKKGKIKKEDSIKAIYHLPNELKQSSFSSLVKRTLLEKDCVVELIPYQIRKKYRLLSHYVALKKIHFPLDEEDIYLGQRTLKYEECLEFCLKNRIIRDTNKAIVRRNNEKISFIKIDQFINSLPFKLSNDQLLSSKEILNDMNSSSIMYRLLQGDVGSGKTLVATIALYGNYTRGNQGVLMVPTDSLARQHFENIKSYCEPFGIKCGLLVSSLPISMKKDIKRKILNKEIDIVIGTHAVFSKDVEYASLGLAIIDEQHRFGVNQRNLLTMKGDYVDLLLMSATPIPRTLSLSIFGDLDVSTLKEFPNKERKVITKVCDYDSQSIEGLINYCLLNNKQVFMVCPKISSSIFETKSVEEIYEKYKSIYGEKISILHGKMDNNEKNQVLEKFRKGDTPILVSTTVVELGIDVKNAMGIIVFSANSFGLSSLHQLRGRVGRDGSTGYCLLVDHFEEGEDSSRLKILESTLDGFIIAEQDMKMRGPGDMIGVMQSGFPSFSCLNIFSDFKMFEYAREDASNILNNLNESENRIYFEYVTQKMKKEEEQLTLFD